MSHPPQLRRHLRLFDATMLVVGSGIFFGLSIMAQWVQTPGLLIGLWIFGGLFTILGAVSVAELAAMFPHAGGQYVFLREAFHDFWAFLFGWTQFLVIQTGFNAAVAIAFAKYLGALLPALGEANVLARIPLGVLLPAALQAHLPEFLHHLEINSAQLVACAVIALLTAINIRGICEGAWVQNLFTVLKILALTGSYSELLTYSTFASVFFGGLTVVAVYRLRATQPDRPRPYRCWGYPVTPALYLVICVAFLLYVVQGDPHSTMIGVVLVLAGIPFYLVWNSRR